MSDVPFSGWWNSQESFPLLVLSYVISLLVSANIGIKKVFGGLGSLASYQIFIPAYSLTVIQIFINKQVPKLLAIFDLLNTIELFLFLKD